MKKIIAIEGMHCPKCAGRVENALNGIEGVNAKVNLSKKCAIASVNESVSDEAMKSAVEALGFQVVSITEKKGIFG